jgi:calmodulin
VRLRLLLRALLFYILSYFIFLWQFTEHQVAEFKECFEMFDVDGSGSIDKEELHFVLHMLGSKMTQKEIGDILEEVDENSSGDVEFAEFCALMARQMYATGEEHQLRQVFNLLDESG